MVDLIPFNLLSKSWSSGPGQSQMALPKSKAVDCWNIGMLEYWVWRIEIYFYMDDTDQKLKSGHHPLFIPNIPFISPSRRLCEPEATIPLFHWVSNDKHHPYGVKSKPGPLVQDYLLIFMKRFNMKLAYP